jgi:two-component system sensor histidine kinase PhcS
VSWADLLPSPTLSPYHQELSEFRLAYSQAGCIVSIVLVLLGLGLDYSLNKSSFQLLASGRILTAAASFGVLVALRSSYGLHWVRPLTLLWLALPQIMIAWMIWSTEGTESIYFVGLHLALYATGIILPIAFWENLAFGLFTYALYFVACYLHPEGLQNLNRFVGSSLFILFSVAASSVCTYFNERGRIKLFRLQRQVAEKNSALLGTNETLAQVKGQLVQQEKMAALGTLSAGLLHEVNNPVNYSLMALNMALMEPEMEKNPNLKESLTDAKEGMQRVQNIVTDLKTFAYQKPGENQNRIFLLEKSVHSAIRLTGFELKGVEIAVDLPQDTHVLGDEPALIGVLINLLGNAGQALNTSKRERPRIDLKAKRVGDRLHAHIRDNGAGIKQENLSRVFEPFFTTRDVGKGLGLGLSMSYSIIQRHGGTLDVTSEEGQWTEFSFDLELANQDA